MRRCWAPLPVRPLCRAMVTHEYTYAYGAVDVLNGELDSLILPPYASDLNPVEHLWDELREKHFPIRLLIPWMPMDALENQLQTGLLALENDMPQVKSIVAWDWNVNALLK